MFLNTPSIYTIPKICLVFLKNHFDNVIEDEGSAKFINENGLYKQGNSAPKRYRKDRKQ